MPPFNGTEVSTSSSWSNCNTSVDPSLFVVLRLRTTNEEKGAIHPKSLMNTWINHGVTHPETKRPFYAAVLYFTKWDHSLWYLSCISRGQKYQGFCLNVVCYSSFMFNLNASYERYDPVLLLYIIMTKRKNMITMMMATIIWVMKSRCWCGWINWGKDIRKVTMKMTTCVSTVNCLMTMRRVITWCFL